MKKLLAAATAAITALAAAPANAEVGAYDNALLVFAVYSCASHEGLMTTKEAADAAVDLLAAKYEVSPYQLQNFYKKPNFLADVVTVQREIGGCPKVARDIKQSPVLKKVYR